MNMSKKKEDSVNKNELDLFKIKQRASKSIEHSLLSCLLLDSDSIELVIDMLNSEMFFYPDSKLIFNAIQSLYRKKISIDVVTLFEELKLTNKYDEAGGVVNINNIVNSVTNAIHVEDYAKLLYEYYIERQIIEVNLQVFQKSQSGMSDAFDLLEFNNKKLSDISDSIKSNSSQSISNALHEELLLIGKRMQNAEEGKVIGVPTGFRDLDKLTGGWQNGDLIIVAGRPSMGKTAATLNFARNAAVIGGFPVAVFSLEMSESQITSRLISSETMIDSESIKKGTLSKQDYARMTVGLDRLSKSELFIDDTPALSLMELKVRARRLKNHHDIGLIVIDYLQLMSSNNKRNEGNREQEISSISRGLKSLAKELNLPVIALSQLSRAVENRAGDKRPFLSDLRESGSIEQDADIVMFLYRGEYYGFDKDIEGKDQRGLAEFIIAKNRNGSLGTIQVRFEGRFVKFSDIGSTPYTGGGNDNQDKDYGIDTPF